MTVSDNFKVVSIHRRDSGKASSTEQVRGRSSLNHQTIIEIPYQTDEILVVNKPCGMSTQGGAGAGMPLDEVLRKQLCCKAGADSKVFLVHRLDRGTAGLMVVAKTSQAAAKWTRLVAGHEVVKEYLAISIGLPKTPRGTITVPIAGKNAVTEYMVIGVASLYGEATPLSLIRCRLLTGRTHQIRIHLASIGCPIVGDDKHGNFALNRALRKACAVRRLCLASVRLTLPDGTVVEAPPPPHMVELMNMAGIDILPL